MNRFLSLALLLPALASAEPVQFEMSAVNPDGSVTISGITVSRGDEVYPIGATKVEGDWATATCRLLGYKEALTGGSLNSYERVEDSDVVVLNRHGGFEQIATGSYVVSKVTCYASADLVTQVFDFDRKKNADGSVTLSNFKYMRGDEAFPVGMADQTAYEAVCHLAGYDHALLGGQLNQHLRGNETSLIVLNRDGSYNQTASGYYYVSKTTCFSGTEPKLIVLIKGTRYRRIR